MTPALFAPLMSEQDAVETIALPADLVHRVETRVQHTEFADVEAYLTHVLEEILYEAQTDADLEAAESVDEQQVQERLKSLGYLNE